MNLTYKIAILDKIYIDLSDTLGIEHPDTMYAKGKRDMALEIYNTK